MRITTINTPIKTWTIAFVIGIPVVVLGLYLKKSEFSKNSKRVSNQKRATPTADSEKFHINVAAGASVSIPISAQGDIDIKLGSDNGDNCARHPIEKIQQLPSIDNGANNETTD